MAENFSNLVKDSNLQTQEGELTLNTVNSKKYMPRWQLNFWKVKTKKKSGKPPYRKWHINNREIQVWMTVDFSWETTEKEIAQHF